MLENRFILFADFFSNCDFSAMKSTFDIGPKVTCVMFRILDWIFIIFWNEIANPSELGATARAAPNTLH